MAQNLWATSNNIVMPRIQPAVEARAEAIWRAFRAYPLNVLPTWRERWHKTFTQAKSSKSLERS